MHVAFHKSHLPSLSFLWCLLSTPFQIIGDSFHASSLDGHETLQRARQAQFNLLLAQVQQAQVGDSDCSHPSGFMLGLNKFEDFPHVSCLHFSQLWSNAHCTSVCSTFEV